MNDSFARQVDYLRISITDRCNERCLYCMPEGYKGWQRKEDHLTAEEIVRVVAVAAKLGFRKFRLTGGEPLLRGDIADIVSGMKKIPGVETIGLSTNGTKLAKWAAPLRAAGIRTANVSLDALDPTLYRDITGGDINSVLAGIDAAVESGVERVKLNCVLMRGVNEQEIWPLVLFAAERNLPLRFIELMPLTRTDVLTEKNFFPVGEAMQLLSGQDELIPQPDTRIGHGPAKYFRLKQTGALIGFIGDHGEIDLRPALHQTAPETLLHDKFLEALRLKPLEHLFRSQYQPLRPMTAIGG